MANTNENFEEHLRTKISRLDEEQLYRLLNLYGEKIVDKVINTSNLWSFAIDNSGELSIGERLNVINHAKVINASDSLDMSFLLLLQDVYYSRDEEPKNALEDLYIKARSIVTRHNLEAIIEEEGFEAEEGLRKKIKVAGTKFTDEINENLAMGDVSKLNEKELTEEEAQVIMDETTAKLNQLANEIATCYSADGTISMSAEQIYNWVLAWQDFCVGYNQILDYLPRKIQLDYIQEAVANCVITKNGDNYVYTLKNGKSVEFSKDNRVNAMAELITLYDEYQNGENADSLETEEKDSETKDPSLSKENNDDEAIVLTPEEAQKLLNSEQAEELSELIAQNAPFMTPEALDEYVDKFISSRAGKNIKVEYSDDNINETEENNLLELSFDEAKALLTPSQSKELEKGLAFLKPEMIDEYLSEFMAVKTGKNIKVVLGDQKETENSPIERDEISKAVPAEAEEVLETTTPNKENKGPVVRFWHSDESVKETTPEPTTLETETEPEVVSETEPETIPEPEPEIIPEPETIPEPINLDNSNLPELSSITSGSDYLTAVQDYAIKSQKANGFTNAQREMLENRLLALDTYEEATRYVIEHEYELQDDIVNIESTIPLIEPVSETEPEMISETEQEPTLEPAMSESTVPLIEPVSEPEPEVVSETEQEPTLEPAMSESTVPLIEPASETEPEVKTTSPTFDSQPTMVMPIIAEEKEEPQPIASAVLQPTVEMPPIFASEPSLSDELDDEPVNDTAAELSRLMGQEGLDRLEPIPENNRNNFNSDETYFTPINPSDVKDNFETGYMPTVPPVISDAGNASTSITYARK